ncbi:PEP-CTERM sorting domain-containing protein [Pelomonas sp. P7]|uniref:PEP-CTERM sorting domain-containing protein n=1 Tax=Pelomonas caseinilytica TaxID=2906763 RepID=A0ABS8XFN9_9BURK|nr:PEP-CTERM sorting domain-containing protein [Pelomonas sp. P7]MCE4539704.1 PEP-CTERM sorting domain-containing protein [Pelomonas sp. P7]
MLKNFKFVVGAALVAASQLAAADTAEVKISNLSLSVSGGGWWYYLPTGVDWVPVSAGTSVGLSNPSFADSAAVWHGQAASSSVVDGASMATASLTAKTPNTNLDGVSALAKVDVSGGQAGWSFAKVIDNQILVANGATITVSMKVDSLLAAGAMSQGNAYIELCSTDFTTDTCLPANYTEAVVFGDTAYSGPSMLTASWTNPSTTANTWAKIHIGLTASAESVAAVPEPSSMAMLLAGLAGVGIYRRRKG